MMGHRDSHRGEGRVMHHRLGYLIAEAAPRPLLRLCAAAVTAVALLSACTGGEQQAVPQRQMVAAANPLAAEAGMAMLRSEEHTSALQSIMRISYAVFCLNKKKQKRNN